MAEFRDVLGRGFDIVGGGLAWRSSGLRTRGGGSSPGNRGQDGLWPESVFMGAEVLPTLFGG